MVIIDRGKSRADYTIVDRFYKGEGEWTDREDQAKRFESTEDAMEVAERQDVPCFIWRIDADYGNRIDLVADTEKEDCS
jgi:hypothetical protein